MTTEKKIVLITGVSRREGLGFGLAKAFLAEGFDVLITARQREAAEALSDELSGEWQTIMSEALDITNQESVDALATFVEKRYQRLDVLVNNAGAGMDYMVEPLQTNFADTRAAFETNVFGAWRMVIAFVPLLRKSDHPRIVNVSSGAGSFADPVFGLGVHPAIYTSYGLSKLALNGLTVKLHRQLNPEGILVNSVCPGFVATAPGLDEMGARPVADAAPGIVWAATLQDGGPSGGFFRDGKPLAW